MTQAVQEIMAQIEELTPQERAEVAYATLCSLEAADENVDEAWRVELAERLEEIQSGRATGKPAEQVFAELRRKQA